MQHSLFDCRPERDALLLDAWRRRCAAASRLSSLRRAAERKLKRGCRMPLDVSLRSIGVAMKLREALVSVFFVGEMHSHRICSFLWPKITRDILPRRTLLHLPWSQTLRKFL